MRKSMGVSVAAALLVLGPAASASAVNVPAPGTDPNPYVAVEGNVRFSAGEVCVGSPVTIEGDAFTPASTVRISSDGAVVATDKADGNGAVSKSVSLPEGKHAIKVSGPGDGGTRTLTGDVSVVACAPVKVEGVKVSASGGGPVVEGSSLPRTGGNISTPLVAGTGFLLVGAALLLVPSARKRRRRTS